MDSNPSPYAVRTSKPSFISGGLAVLDYAEFLADEYPKALRKAIKQATYEEQTALRENADTNSEWSGLADGLSVRFDNQQTMFVYGTEDAPENAQKSKDLEYGVPTKNAPSPLLRTFAKSRETDLGKKIADLVDKELVKRYK